LARDSREWTRVEKEAKTGEIIGMGGREGKEASNRGEGRRGGAQWEWGVGETQERNLRNIPCWLRAVPLSQKDTE